MVWIAGSGATALMCRQSVSSHELAVLPDYRRQGVVAFAMGIGHSSSSKLPSSIYHFMPCKIIDHDLNLRGRPQPIVVTPLNRPRDADRFCL